jgi:hypothetical protein
MKTNEYYQKVVIESEKDLPKGDEKYHIHLIGDSNLRFCSPEGATFRQIKKRIDWYLLPVQSSIPELTDEEIEKAFLMSKNLTSPSFYDESHDNYYRRQGAKWYRTRLRELKAQQSEKEIIINFLRENNWLSLENEKNASDMIDSYLKIYGTDKARPSDEDNQSSGHSNR